PTTTAAAPTVSAPTVSAPTTTATPTSQWSSSSAASKGKPSSDKAGKVLSGHVRGATVGRGGVPTSRAAVRNGQAPLRTFGGAPTLQNPTFSFALPTPAPLGVPNFFIDSFQ